MSSSRVLTCLPLIIFILCAIPYWDYIPDDTFIAIRYARNLASGYGFSYNPGEPTYGFTSPLWVMLTAVFRMLGADLVVTAKLLSTVFGLSSIWVLYLLSSRIIKTPLFAWLVPVAFAYDPWFIRWSSSGMETSLALFLVLLGLLLHLKERDGGFPVSSVLFGLATLTRPEAGLLFALMFLEGMLSPPRRGRVWQSLLGYLAILLPWLLFSLVRFGTPIPNTLNAKYGALGGASLVVSLALRAGKIVGTTYLPYVALILTVLLFPRFRSHLKPYLLLLAWIILLPLFYILGRLPPASRYLLLFFPFLLLLGFLSLSIVSSGWTVERRFYLTGVLLVIVLALNTHLGWFINYPNCKLFAQGMKDSHVYIGRWFKNNTDSDVTIAAGDIGAIGYYSERKIVDLGALVTPQLIPLMRSCRYQEIVKTGVYLDLARADYLVNRASSPFSLIQSSDAEELYEPLFYRSTPTLGLTTPHTRSYYSVYRVRKGK